MENVHDKSRDNRLLFHLPYNVTHILNSIWDYQGSIYVLRI